ncbi:hypothetical protein Godav_013409 [Gossypium davidsonii]|uniref:Kinesin-like protein n=1 Tax=Gossypium davidsonii TaxID=34287 RepID=A0A7J8RH45_GOSDV|nr:hypothetical protein [Gossypium davidsonii]
MEKICVAVRVRPPICHENSSSTFWGVDDNQISLHKLHGSPISGVSYTFDHVFDENCSNSDIYELLTKDIIHAAVDGFNGTAFAYGQTSSGKTFTMNGSSNDPGIIHRAVNDIFQKINMISDREFLIRVSYMEIYNEEINDLFAVENQKLQIHENLERGIFVAGLREEIVNNAEQVMKLLESGEVNRHFGETNMNARSSRSHTIFRVVIESKGKDTGSFDDYSSSDAIRVSVLNLVDLAGSERIAKTGTGGVRLKEGKYINKSLMVLGNVINKLSDSAKRRAHIPYRDSKLTRILQPALGGNAKTSIICTVAPEEIHIEETKGTLLFASRAKRVTNCAQVNEVLTDAALLKRQKLEIEELRWKLQGSHAEVLEQEILKLRNDMLKYELEREKLEMELEKERRSHKERDQYIRDQLMMIENLSSLVSDGDGSSSQGSMKESPIEECHNRGDDFKTPCFKAAPKAFVAKRSNYSQLPDFSPLPDSFSDVADEDTWFKINKGYIADLDSLQTTPARKVQSFPPEDVTPVIKFNKWFLFRNYLNKKYKKELQNLKRRLELVTEEKNELQRKLAEDIEVKDRLKGDISKLKQEALLAREMPQRLCGSVTSFKDTYEEVLSKMQVKMHYVSLIQLFISNLYENINLLVAILSKQRYTFDGKSSTAKLLRCISEIGSILFSTMETSISNTTDRHKLSSENDSLIQEYNKMLSEKLKSTITSLILSETASSEDKQTKTPCSCNFEVVAWSRYHVSILVLFFVMILGYFVPFFRTLIF